jgi:hypothetical protein
MEDNFKKPSELKPDVVIDIDDVMDTKIKMLHCHTTQMYEWLPWMDGNLDQVPKDECERLKWLTEKQYKRDGKIADRFRKNLIERYGEVRGAKIKCAEAFEISEYGAQIPPEKMSCFFPF